MSAAKSKAKECFATDVLPIEYDAEFVRISFRVPSGVDGGRIFSVFLTPSGYRSLARKVTASIQALAH